MEHWTGVPKNLRRKRREVPLPLLTQLSHGVNGPAKSYAPSLWLLSAFPLVAFILCPLREFFFALKRHQLVGIDLERLRDCVDGIQSYCGNRRRLGSLEVPPPRVIQPRPTMRPERQPRNTDGTFASRRYAAQLAAIAEKVRKAREGDR